MNQTNKQTIIAIVGPSGSGKTTISLYLFERYGIPFISSYTTRPMRDGETDGVEHMFVSDMDVPPRSEMIAYTLFGGHQYWATKSQVHDVCSYVIDEKGLLGMLNRFGDHFNIIKVYVSRDGFDMDRSRVLRDNERTVLQLSFYDVVINNNYSCKEDLCEDAGKIIQQYLKNTQCQ